MSGRRSFPGVTALTASLITAAGCAGLLTLAACAGLNRPAESRNTELTLAAALAQLDALPIPAGADPAQFEQLRESLRAQLGRSGITKWVSGVPTDADNAVGDLYLTRIDDTTATARWTYKNVGDYDQNSQVNISDLSALGAHLGKTTASPDWSAARAADGDGNGAVTISDLTPLGSHLQNTISGYFIEATTTPEVESSWAQVTLADFDDSVVPGTGGLRQFSVDIPAAAGQSFRIVALGEAQRGVAGAPFAYTGQTSGPAVPPEERMAVLDSIKDKFNNLTTTTSDEQDAELASFIAAQPHIEEAGYFEGNAWGRFTDGRFLVVCKNMGIDPSFDASQFKAPGMAAAARTTSDMNVPVSSDLMFFNAFRQGDIFVAPDASIKQIAEANGYNVSVLSATIANMKTASNVGCFHLFGHGGFVRLQDGTPSFVVWTADEPTLPENPDFHPDLDAGRIGYCIADDNAGVSGLATTELRYCIAPDFIRTYVSFSKSSFAFINSCSSSVTDDMATACFDAGASAYFGWSRTTSNHAVFYGTRYFFDRLLGANELGRTENPPMRPYDFSTILVDMSARGVRAATPALPSEPEIYNYLTVRRNPNTPLDEEFGLLAPSIQWMAMFDNGLNGVDELWIAGLFGDEEGFVTVGGVDVDIMSWAPYEIHVELPASGQGSFGDVVVENGSIGQHRSNARQLTEWRGTFMLEGVDVEGGLKRNVSFGVHFRADLQNHRYFPDEELIPSVFGDGIVPVFGATDCIGVVSSEGSQVWDNGYTETWDNGPDTVLPIHDGVSPLTQFMQCYGEIDLLQSKLFLNLYATGDFHRTVRNDEGEISSDGLSGFIDDVGTFIFDDTSEGMEFELDENFGIAGGTRSGQYGDMIYTLTWPAMPAQSPPDPAAPR